jgi:hypothetical protein
MNCVKCGIEMRRLTRESFLQRRFLPLFGFFPWECPICRKPILLKRRFLSRRESRLTDFTAIEAKRAEILKRRSSAKPEAKAS